MAYLSVEETARLWQMNERRVRSLCRDKRIPGSLKQGNSWMIPQNAKKPLDARTRAYAQEQASSTQMHTEATNAVARFESIYGKQPDQLIFTPYRVCPIGAHIDHQWGKITGLAIDKGVHMAYRPKQNGVVELSSINFPKRAQWHIASTPEQR